jgi:hypothetical protein
MPDGIITDEEIIDLFEVRIPDLLARRPELEPRIYYGFMKIFASKAEVAAVLAELRTFRAETGENFERVEQRLDRMDQRFEQIDQRFDGVDQRFDGVDQRLDRLETRMEAGFAELHRAIDRLGARWGIRNESVFRQTVASLLEESFGVQVEQRWIGGEQFDCIIFDGQHILVEISASVGPNIQATLERKQRIYTEATGVEPARVILATASIHSRRAQALRDAGFEVIEPEEEVLDQA